MQELLKNAWQGWLAYTGSGKYAVLLLLVLLFFWFRREACKEKLLLVYTTIITACCICPVTAAVLMKYQTGFYTYEWIWSYVPVTLLIAYGLVIFLHGQWEYYKKEKACQKRADKYYMPVLALMVLAVIVLCGGLGEENAQEIYDSGARERTAEVLTALEELSAGALSETGVEKPQLCLWAPKEIMAAARGLRADITLLYGRNMWDAALGAYFYETYGETEEILYLWMCNATEQGSLTYTAKDGRQIDGAWCLQAAKAAGVNVVLLPNTLPLEEVQTLAKQTGHALQQPDGYYLLIL